MSIQWTIVAGFLYFEVVVILLLVLPIASAKRWQRFFRSRFLHVLSSKASLYFYILMFLLVMLLLDAIREMRKYSGSDHEKNHNHAHQLDVEMQGNMRLFRAQRNFYISGFSLFLCLVIRRLINLISTLASTEAQFEAAIKQAESASNKAYNLMTSPSAENSSNEVQGKVIELESKLEDALSQLESERKSKEAMKKQAESLSAEYDRLSEEYNKLEKKLDTQSDGDKKKN